MYKCINDLIFVIYWIIIICLKVFLFILYVYGNIRYRYKKSW